MNIVFSISKTLVIFSLFILNFAYANQLPQLEKECELKNGLSCAKAAYIHRQAKNHIEATKFYQLGCDLKEESSCFNVKNFSPDEQFLSRFGANLKFYEVTIRKCHRPLDNAKVYSTSQLEEKWYLLDISLVINKQGKAKSASVLTNLPKSFVKCAEDVLMNITYPQPTQDDQKINPKISISYLEKI